MQFNLYAKPSRESCVHCPTVYCRLHPCTEAQGIRCCAACISKKCSSMCERIKKGE